MRFYFKKHTENKIYLFIFYLNIVFNILITLNVFIIFIICFNSIQINTFSTWTYLKIFSARYLLRNPLCYVEPILQMRMERRAHYHH